MVLGNPLVRECPVAQYEINDTDQQSSTASPLPQHSCPKSILQPAHTLCSSKLLCKMLTSINPLIPGSKHTKNSRRALLCIYTALDLERPDMRGTPAQISRNSWDIEKIPPGITKQRYPHHTTKIKQQIKCQGAAFDINT